tara:strand:+ start:194 stop:913 length:720 start_codon:yes stop_codon:yes gene_type:complete
MNKLRLFLSFLKIFFRGELEKEYFFLPKIFRSYAPRKSVALDIGSNIGLYSFLLSFYFDKVYSFEPILEMCQRCHGIKKNIFINNVALGDKISQQIINTPIVNGKKVYGLSSISNVFQESHQQLVHIKRLDDYSDIKNVGFIKIDTEGFEDRVIAGARETIAENRPILMIEIEKRHNIESFQNISDIMKELNYKGFYLHANELKLIDSFSFDLYQKLTPSGKCIRPYLNNFFYLPKEKI